jgi:hypothetical protein
MSIFVIGMKIHIDCYVCEENTVLNCRILDKAVGLVRGYKFDVDKLIHVNPYFICTPKPETLNAVARCDKFYIYLFVVQSSLF